MKVNDGGHDLSPNQLKHNSTMVKFDLPMTKLDRCTIARAIREILIFTEYIGDGHNVGHMGSVKRATFGLSVVKVLPARTTLPSETSKNRLYSARNYPLKK